MSWRRAATARHCAAAHAALSTRSVPAHGFRSGCQPSGAAREGAQSSKSAPSPRAAMERKTLATGPPRAMALASAETAARARRHHWTLTVPARTARAAVITGPTTATAAGSRRQA
eukprot:3619526-Lingulodinium_polyedra.AAC.1